MQKRNSFTVYYLITRDHEKFFYKKDKSAHLVILTFPFCLYSAYIII